MVEAQTWNFNVRPSRSDNQVPRFDIKPLNLTPNYDTLISKYHGLIPEYDTLVSDRCGLVLKCDSLATDRHGFGRKLLKMAKIRVFWSKWPARGRMAVWDVWTRQRAFEIACVSFAVKSGGGPPQSKTLARWLMIPGWREAFWSAPALWRFGRSGIQHKSQRRQGAGKTKNALRLCAFASLRCVKCLCRPAGLDFISILCYKDFVPMALCWPRWPMGRFCEHFGGGVKIIS